MGRSEAVRRSEQPSRRLPAALGAGRHFRGMEAAQGEGWNALSTLMAGICVWGAIGFGLDHLFGTYPVLTIVGVLAGNFLGVYLIYAKHLAAAGEQEPVLAPAVAGWSTRVPVAGSSPDPHPPAPELAAWPNVKHASGAHDQKDAHHAS